MQAINCIIVGGGSAGAVLASRLSEDPDRRVLLIEAGRDYTLETMPPEVRDLWPRAMFYDRNLWTGLRVRSRSGETEPLKLYEQGRILGGTSSINGMNAPRGTPVDFEEWVRRGASGWSYTDVLPYFRRLERDLDFADEHHGADGPIPIRRSFPQHWPPFTKAAVEAARNLGLPYHEDHNAVFGDGVYSQARSTEADRRVSTATAYLGPEVRARKNLIISCNTLVDRVVIVDRRVQGVEIVQGGARRTVAACEVAISAGALHSPAILLRSGIGPGADLQPLGIPVVSDRVGVGQNLQDHPFVSLAGFLRRPFRQPPTLPIQAQAFVRLTSGIGDAPQDLFVFLHNRFGWHALGQRFGMIIVCLYKAVSRGHVRLASRDPAVEPDVVLNLLGDLIDVRRLSAGLWFAHRLMHTAPLSTAREFVFPAAYSEAVRRLNRYDLVNRIKAASIARMLDVHPGLRARLLSGLVAGGVGLDQLLADETRLAAWLRDNVAACWHACGTCAMGAADDPAAVTDTQGRVYGVSGLRVVDASIMPTVVRANTNITTIMMAEKIAAEWR